MIGSSITRRYAEALISIGVEEDSCDTFESELTKINETLNENPELRNIIYGSVYPRKERKEILKEVMDRLGVSEDVEHFLSLLIDKNRIEFLPHILKRYEELLDEIVGRVRAQVIVAKSMPDESLVKLKETFEKVTGKAVILEVAEDPAIIGGIVTKLGNVIFDGSIRTQLEKVKRSIVRGEEG